MIEHLRSRGFEVDALDAPRTGHGLADEVPAGHAAWLGASWSADAEETRRHMVEARPDWLVVDHYALAADWEAALRPACRRVMVIDDLADRRHDCDVLLDSNWHADRTATRYEGLVPAAARVLLGPRYALLNPDYAKLRRSRPARDGSVRRVLVFLGGSDATDHTSTALEALAQPGLRHLAVDVVVGVNHPDPQRVAAAAAARPGTTLHRAVPSLAGLMATADLMIGGGGVTTWERMCMGLPALVISMAANQTAANQALQDAGFINFLGETAEVDSPRIVRAVERCLAEPERLRAQSARMQALVAGDGVDLVCSALESVPGRA